MFENIQKITPKSFERYGHVIFHDHTKKESFQIVLNEFEEVGWRIAVSKITDKAIKILARHPNSMETFEPMEGVTVICVAPANNPMDYELFLLDKPVCLYKNIWHSTMSISEYSIVKICENAHVETEEYDLT